MVHLVMGDKSGIACVLLLTVTYLHNSCFVQDYWKLKTMFYCENCPTSELTGGMLMCTVGPCMDGMSDFYLF